MNDAPQLPGEHPSIPSALTKKIAARLHALADLATDLSDAGLTAEAKIAGGLLEGRGEGTRSMILHRTPTHNYVSRPFGRTERVERFAHALAYVAVIASIGLLTAVAVAGVANGSIW